MTLAVPLTAGEQAVTDFVGQHGGSVSGGSFSAAGWTTTSRDDRIVIPLPAGIDARRGSMAVTFTNPELDGPSGFYESFILVSLDADAGPYTPTPAGTAGIQSLYVAHHELGQPLFKVKGYFNLFDPTCTDWHDCTGERGVPDGWLGDGSGSYTIAHDWQGGTDTIQMTGGASNQTKSLDLTPTSTGVIAAPELYLLINACGGSSNNSCGQWDGPVHGGPLGIVYESVTLELVTECGDATCASGLETCDNCAADCGPCEGEGGGGQGGGDEGGSGVGGSGVGGSTSSGATGGATSTTGSSTSSGNDASPNADADGSCSIRPREGASGSSSWLLAVALLTWARRARRGRRGWGAAARRAAVDAG